MAQLAKIIDSVNPDISSDSGSDGEEQKFGPVALSAASRSIARLWLAQARRRKRLTEVVQSIINRARREECEQCLSRKSLQVELVTPIEVLADRYDLEHPDEEEFNQVAWKNFFKKHQKFRTLCLNCISKRQAEERKRAKAMGGKDFSDDDDGPVFPAVFLNAATTALLNEVLST